MQIPASVNAAPAFTGTLAPVSGVARAVVPVVVVATTLPAASVGIGSDVVPSTAAVAVATGVGVSLGKAVDASVGAVVPVPAGASVGVGTGVGVAVGTGGSVGCDVPLADGIAAAEDVGVIVGWEVPPDDGVPAADAGVHLPQSQDNRVPPPSPMLRTAGLVVTVGWSVRLPSEEYVAGGAPSVGDGSAQLVRRVYSP